MWYATTRCAPSLCRVTWNCAYYAETVDSAAQGVRLFLAFWLEIYIAIHLILMTDTIQFLQNRHLLLIVGRFLLELNKYIHCDIQKFFRDCLFRI